MGRPAVDISGKVFGFLTVLRRVENSGGAGIHVKWIVRCVCGNQVEVEGTRLRRGRSRSCGCRRHDLQRPQVTKHGLSKTRTYEAWSQMRSRCGNPRHQSFEHYGGRGIKVCERWKDSFEAFFDDMGPCPRGHSLDRIDNDGNYEPGNCRWATPKEQALNRRTNRIIRYRGEAHPLSVWAERFGMTFNVLSGRIRRGWTMDEAIAGRKVA